MLLAAASSPRERCGDACADTMLEKRPRALARDLTLPLRGCASCVWMLTLKIRRPILSALSILEVRTNSAAYSGSS